jgi:hypothetical protein
VCDFFFKTINCAPKNIIGQSTSVNSMNLHK